MFKFAVFGNPVRHSLSPTIHRSFAHQAGIDIQYEAIECTSLAFEVAVDNFFRSGGGGANITLPFKERAFSLAATVSPAARLAAAANTLLWSDEQLLLADNTDGVGLVRDLTIRHGLDLEPCRILLLGAGGAVRGVLGPLLTSTTQPVTVVNRTLLKAQHLAKQFADLGQVIPCSYAELANHHYDVIINGTSASLSGMLPALPDALSCHNTLAYDMMYGEKPTVFMQWAKRRGASLVRDGLGMLLQQAAESFYLWTGYRPNIEPVHNQLMSLRTGH